MANTINNSPDNTTDTVGLSQTELDDRVFGADNAQVYYAAARVQAPGWKRPRYFAVIEIVVVAPDLSGALIVHRSKLGSPFPTERRAADAAYEWASAEMEKLHRRGFTNAGVECDPELVAYTSTAFVPFDPATGLLDWRRAVRTGEAAGA